MNHLIYCLPLLAAIAAGAQSTPLTFRSATEQTALLELYTSEGCSSCPAAETWLSRLKASPGLWRDFVPVAFHVDYWDYLGWRDPWAKRAFSERQRGWAERWQSDSIYTPGLVLNGKEWRDWPEDKNGPKPAKTTTGVLSVTCSDKNHWQVSFAPANSIAAGYEVHAALLAGSLTSDVKAGENRGRRLNHDFVVLNLVGAALSQSGSVAQGDFTLTVTPKDAGESLAIAVWITQIGSNEPLQATGGWLGESGRPEGTKRD
jgi:hypothetical protein